MPSQYFNYDLFHHFTAMYSQSSVMNVYLLLTLICLVFSLPSFSKSDENLESLRAVQTKIVNSTEKFCYGTKHSKTANNFLSSHWNSYTGDKLNVLVYPFCLTTYELGNRLGNFFTEVACAEAAGNTAL